MRGQLFINDRNTTTGMFQATSVLSDRFLNEFRVSAFHEMRPSNSFVSGPEVTVRNAGATVAIYGPQATGLSWGNVGYTLRRHALPHRQQRLARHRRAHGEVRRGREHRRQPDDVRSRIQRDLYVQQPERLPGAASVPVPAVRRHRHRRERDQADRVLRAGRVARAARAHGQPRSPLRDGVHARLSGRRRCPGTASRSRPGSPTRWI